MVVEALLMGKILTGDYDEDLDRIVEWCMQRKRTLRQVKAAEMRFTLKPGDTVVVGNIRPKRLSGQRAKVVEIRKSRALIEFLDKLATGYSFGVTVPLSCLVPA